MKQEQSKDKDFKIIVKAEELCEHTFRLTSNCNRFPKKYRFTLCDKMQTKAMNVYENVFDANSTRLSDLRLRNELQSKAIAECTKLCFYIRMCMDLEIIDSKSAEYWSALVSDIKFMTIAWRSADKNSQHR